MGGEEDPKDGAAVAGAVFGAVFIYIVRSIAFMIARGPSGADLANMTGRASSFSADCRLFFTCAKAVAAR